MNETDIDITVSKKYLVNETTYILGEIGEMIKKINTFKDLSIPNHPLYEQYFDDIMNNAACISRRISDMRSIVIDKRNPILENVLIDTSDFMGVLMEDVLSETRKRECVITRYFACMTIKYCYNKSLKQTGAMIHKHHATVLSGIKSIKNLYYTKDHEYYYVINNYVDYMQAHGYDMRMFIKQLKS